MSRDSASAPARAVTTFTWGGTVYYRASLNGPPKHQSLQTKILYEQSTQSLTDVETGQILEMTDTNASGVIAEMNEALASLPVWPFLLLPGLVASMWLYSALYFLSAGALALLIVVASLTALYLDGIRRSVVLMYDMDSESIELFETFTRSFDLLIRSIRIWNIQARGRQSDWRLPFELVL